MLCIRRCAYPGSSHCACPYPAPSAERHVSPRAQRPTDRRLARSCAGRGELTMRLCQVSLSLSLSCSRSFALGRARALSISWSGVSPEGLPWNRLSVSLCSKELSLSPLSLSRPCKGWPCRSGFCRAPRPFLGFLYFPGCCFFDVTCDLRGPRFQLSVSVLGLLSLSVGSQVSFFLPSFAFWGSSVAPQLPASFAASPLPSLAF